MKTIHWIILGIITVFVFSCTPKPTRYPISEIIDRPMIPYSVGNRVRFINEKDDTITLTTTKETSSWFLFEDIFLFERREILLQSDSCDYSLSLLFNSWETEIIGNRKIFISFCQPIDDYCNGFVSYDAAGNFKQCVYDSLLINNKIFYNVSLQEDNYIVYPNQNHSTQTYYNKTYGVLQMILDERPVFTLDTVIFADKR